MNPNIIGGTLVAFALVLIIIAFSRKSILAGTLAAVIGSAAIPFFMCNNMTIPFICPNDGGTDGCGDVKLTIKRTSKGGGNCGHVHTGTKDKKQCGKNSKTFCVNGTVNVNAPKDGYLYSYCQAGKSSHNKAYTLVSDIKDPDNVEIYCKCSGGDCGNSQYDSSSVDASNWHHSLDDLKFT